MSRGIFFQKIKYHYKKYLANIFSCIGLALLVGAMVYMFMPTEDGTSVTYGSIINCMILLASFICILVGNVQGSTIAYQGILIFIFYLLWDFGDYLVISLLTGSLANIFYGDVVVTVLTLLFLGGSIAGLVVGILLYIRLRQFLTGRYSSYVGLRNMALVYMFLVIVFNAILPIALLLYQTSLGVALGLLENFAVIFEAVAAFFTICRLKSEY